MSVQVLIYANPRTREVELTEQESFTVEMAREWETRGLRCVGSVTFNGLERPRTKFTEVVDDALFDAILKAVNALLERSVTRIESELHRLRYAN